MHFLGGNPTPGRQRQFFDRRRLPADPGQLGAHALDRPAAPGHHHRGDPGLDHRAGVLVLSGEMFSHLRLLKKYIIIFELLYL